MQCAAWGQCVRSRPLPDTTKCPGVHKLLPIIKYPKGHMLIMGDTLAGPFLVCHSCGMWGMSAPKLLRRRCLRPNTRTTAGQRQVELIANGKTPPPHSLAVRALWRLNGAIAEELCR